MIPHVTVGKENSNDIELYYEDHGSGNTRNRRRAMTNYTHETVPTNFVETKGIRYAYRRFGNPGTVPLLFLGYFNSNLDAWDPTVTNNLATDHEVILFANAGI